MLPAQNKALVRRYYQEMWGRWDFPLADELIDEAVVFRGSLGTEVRGREGFKEYVRAVRRAFPDFRNHVEERIAEDDRVVLRDQSYKPTPFARQQASRRGNRAGR